MSGALLTITAAFPHLIDPPMAWPRRPHMSGAFEVTRDVPGAGLDAGDVLLFHYRPRKVGRWVRVQPIEVPRAAVAAVIAAADVLRAVDGIGPLGHESVHMARRRLLRGLQRTKPDAQGVSPLHRLRPPTSITADTDALAVELLLLELGGAAAG